MKPFLKWAGGKRWLFTAEFAQRLPSYDRYIEPFLGGGAAYLTLEPPCAMISDVNEELINVYRTIRDFPNAIKRGLKKYHEEHSKAFYYEVRARQYSADVEGALRTLYLNRTCWNGLYRLNLRGQFNVPIGTKSAIYSEDEDFSAISKLLRKAEITVSDFESALSRAGYGDLVFIDPPYTVKHNINGFIKYNESIFSWNDQERLAQCVKESKERGAAVILTNADHSSVRDLYKDVGVLTSVSRASIISGKVDGRTSTTELLLIA